MSRFSFPWANWCVFCLCNKGFYFIAKSPPLPGEDHLTYSVMMNVLKGKTDCSAPYVPFIQVLNYLCLGIFNVIYLGEITDVGPLPFGCYCSIENDTVEVLGTAVVWPGPIHLL